MLLLIYVFWEILKNQSPLSPVEVLKILRSFFEIKFVPFQLLNVLFSYLWISPSVYWQLLFRVRITELWLTPCSLALGPPLYWNCILEGHWWPHSSHLERFFPLSSQSPWHANATWPCFFNYMYFGFLLWTLLPTHFPVIPVSSLWGGFGSCSLLGIYLLHFEYCNFSSPLHLCHR